MARKTLAERLADARAKAARKAHRDRIADRRAVAEMNRARRATPLRTLTGHPGVGQSGDAHDKETTR